MSISNFPPPPEVVQILKGDPLEYVRDALNCVIIGEDQNKLTLFLSKLSYMRENPTHEILIGDSSSGKTHLARNVLEAFPEEDVLNVSRLTPAWTDYSERELRHKILFVQQFGGVVSASDTFQVLMSEGGLCLGTVRMTSGGFKAITKETEGPISFLSTTIDIKLDPQMETRTFYITPDESTNQTEKIQKHQAYFDMYAWKKEDLLTNLRKFRMVIRFLRDECVKDAVIPFSKIIILASDTLRVRRDRPRLMELVKSLSILRQMKREIVEVNNAKYVVAEWKDFVDILNHCGKVVLQSVKRLSEREEKVLGDIKDWFGQGMDFTADMLQKHSDIQQAVPTFRKHLNNLVKKGYLSMTSGGGRGRLNQYTLLKGSFNVQSSDLLSRFEVIDKSTITSTIDEWEKGLDRDVVWWFFNNGGKLIRRGVD